MDTASKSGITLGGNLEIPTSDSYIGVIVPLPAVRSCYARLIGPQSEALWAKSQSHFCRVLKLQRLEIFEKKIPQQGPLSVGSLKPCVPVGTHEIPGETLNSEIYVGWVGECIERSDASLIQSAANIATSSGCHILDEVVYIGISALLCELLGICIGERVIVSAVDFSEFQAHCGNGMDDLDDVAAFRQAGWPVCRSLELCPLRVEDWDTIQLYANEVEEQLLQQIALVMPSHVVPLWIGNGTKPVFFKVCNAEFKRNSLCTGGKLGVQPEGSGLGSAEDRTSRPLCSDGAPFLLLQKCTEIHVRPWIEPSMNRVRGGFDYSPYSKNSHITSEYHNTDCGMNLRVLPFPHEVDIIDLVNTKNCGSSMRPKLSCPELVPDDNGKGCASMGQKHKQEDLCHSNLLVPSDRDYPSIARRPFQCLVHPMHLAVLRDQQKHYPEGLQPIWWNENGVGGSTEAAMDEDLVTFVVVSVEPHLYSKYCLSIGTSCALLVAIPHPGTPVGYVRVPLQLRHLYGWVVSMHVRINPCVKLPTLPQMLVLTPLFCEQHTELFRNDDSNESVFSNPNARELQAFLESPSGKESIVSYLTDLATAEELCRSTNSELGGRMLIPMVLWDGAVLHLRLKAKKADLHPHRNVSQRKQENSLDLSANGLGTMVCETTIENELTALESEMGGLYLFPEDELTEGDACDTHAVRIDSSHGACTAEVPDTKPYAERGEIARTSNRLGELLKRFTPVDEVNRFQGYGCNGTVTAEGGAFLNPCSVDAPLSNVSSTRKESGNMDMARQLPCLNTQWTVVHESDDTVYMDVCVLVSLNAHNDAARDGESCAAEKGAASKCVFQGTSPVFQKLYNVGNASPLGTPKDILGQNYIVMDTSCGEMLREGRVPVLINSPQYIKGLRDDGVLCNTSWRLKLTLGHGCEVHQRRNRFSSHTTHDSIKYDDIPKSSSVDPTGSKASTACNVGGPKTLPVPSTWWLAPPVLLERKHQGQKPSVTNHALGSSLADSQLLEMIQGCVQSPTNEQVIASFCSLGCSQFQVSCPHPLVLGDFMHVKAFKDSSEKIFHAVSRHLLHGWNLQANCLMAAERKAALNLSKVEPGMILVRGSRGCGKSSFCYSLCAQMQQQLGVFTLFTQCRLLARENIPSSLIRRALYVAIRAAVLHKPSILVLDDLDVLCPAIDDSADAPSMADVRGAHFAEYLCDVLREVVQQIPKACSLDNGNWRGVPCLPSGSVVVIATAEDVGNLHPQLAQPVLFGSSVLSFQPDFSDVSAHTELILKVLDRISGLRKDGNRIKLDPALSETGELHAISRKLEGYSVADIYAVITRAVAEAVFENTTNTVNSELVDMHSIFLGLRHFHKGLTDVIPRNVRQASFIRPQQRLKDVGALEQTKVEIMDMLTLKRLYPSLVRASGVAVHQGIALVGPPGCGKTHLALAAIGESGLRCIHVKGPELLGKYIGSSESAVRMVFKRAQKAKPCAILFDEIEALASKRGGDTTGVTDRVVNQMLCYLDGIESREVCLCGLPASEEDRREILRVCLQAAKISLEHFDLARLASKIPHSFTSADIQAAVNHAQLLAIQETLNIPPCSSTLPSSTKKRAFLSSRHLEDALRECRPSLSTQEILQYHRYCRGFLGAEYQSELDVVEQFLLPVGLSGNETLDRSQVVRIRSKKANSARGTLGGGIASIYCAAKPEVDSYLSCSSDANRSETPGDSCMSEDGVSENAIKKPPPCQNNSGKMRLTGRVGKFQEEQTGKPESQMKEKRQRWKQRQEQPGYRVALA